MMKIKVAETAQKHGVKSAYALQKALNISPTVAARLWKGELDKIGINTLEKLCSHFRCQPNDFLEYPHTLSGNTLSGNTLSGNTLSGKTLSGKTESDNGNMMTFADALSELERIGKPKSDTSLRRYLKQNKLRGRIIKGEWVIQRSDFINFINSEFFKGLK
jgi:DNA-binding Xre family transcriptional regulator